MNNIATIIKRVKGQTSARQTFAFGNQLSFVGSMSNGWRGFWLHFSGRLTIASGSVSPVSQIDSILMALGSIEVTRVRDSGDINIVPAGTPIRELFHDLRKAYQSWGNDVERNGSNQLTGITSSGLPTGAPQIYYKNASGSQSAEDFAVSIYFPFSVPGANDTEADISALVPTAGDRQLNVIISPPAVASPNNDITLTAPFPGSNNSYTLSGVGGIGNAEVIFEADWMGKIAVGSGVGLYSPIWENKIFSFITGATSLNDQELKNWQRGGFWSIISIKEYDYNPTTGAQIVRGNVGNTCLRKFSLYADSDLLLDDSILGRIAKQNPYDYQLTVVGYEMFNPVTINLNSGRSVFSLPDFRPYISADKQINMQFDDVKVQQIASGVTRYISVSVLRYLPLTA